MDDDAEEAAMNDPYRITEAPAGTPRGRLRPAAWLVLILSAATNVVFSSFVGNSLIGSAFGLIALICTATLIVHHYRHRGEATPR